MILVVLSTHAELASATARGRSYWETGELAQVQSILIRTTYKTPESYHFLQLYYFSWYIFTESHYKKQTKGLILLILAQFDSIYHAKVH